MRAPAVPGRENEGAGAVLDRRAGFVFAIGVRDADTRVSVLEPEPPHQRLIVQLEVLEREQFLERPVRRIPRARGTNLARVTSPASTSAVVALDCVLGLRCRPEFDPALLGPRLELD